MSALAPGRAADVERLRKVLAAHPGDAVAWHNLAAAEGDLGNAQAAESAARRAMALGLEAPETRLVLARALQDLGQLDEAERTMEESLALRPAYAEAHRDLAQLRWMRTADREAALARLDEAMAREAHDAGLHLVRAIVLEFAGEADAALAGIEQALAALPQDVALLRQAAHLSAELGLGARAVALARRAAGLAPVDPGVETTLCEALLSDGRIVEAERAAARLAAAHPLDQHAIALRATVWRLLGDPRHAELHDYTRLVSSERLETPSGWRDLGAFLGDLRAELEALHRYRTHPLQQSVRGGSQLPLHAAEMSRPLVRVLFTAIESNVARHLARVGKGSGPFESRNTGRIAFTGAWSVRLASGGYHTDHVHQRGWLSSVCYVSIPPAVQVDDAGRAGWLRLGQPGVRTKPHLPADGYVKPEPGVLVLFPAYVWHGVVPFAAEEPRLSVAFDAIPA